MKLSKFLILFDTSSLYDYSSVFSLPILNFAYIGILYGLLMLSLLIVKLFFIPGNLYFLL